MPPGAGREPAAWRAGRQRDVPTPPGVVGGRAGPGCFPLLLVSGSVSDRPRRFWLMKSEPEAYSLDDLERDGRTHWDGVRNFKARNLMKAMEIGDGVLFYHSNAKPPGIAGVAKVCRTAYPDFTQFDADSKYHDPRATREKPWWYMVDIEFVARFPEEIPLPLLRSLPELQGMALLKRGQRLSVQPVTPEEWSFLLEFGNRAGPSDSGAS